jgi:hypothetical protein
MNIKSLLINAVFTIGVFVVAKKVLPADIKTSLGL